jgi:hypothetical protein
LPPRRHGGAVGRRARVTLDLAQCARRRGALISTPSRRHGLRGDSGGLLLAVRSLGGRIHPDAPSLFRPSAAGHCVKRPDQKNRCGRESARTTSTCCGKQQDHHAQ